MKTLLALPVLILCSIGVAVSPAPHPAPLSPVPAAQQTEANVASTAELIIDHSGYPPGEYHLTLIKNADGSVSVHRSERVVVGLDGEIVDGDVGTPTRPDPGTPDEPVDPQSLLSEVEANFGEDTEGFEATKRGLKLALYVTPGESLISAHDQIQGWFVMELGNDADKWKPWLEWFNAPLVSGEIDNLADFQKHVDLARRVIE